MEELEEEERRALRASKFAPLPPSSSSRSQEPRLAHPGGPLKTNKAAALAKFLERRLQDPNGLASIDPQLLELAVQNAKNAVCSSSGGTSNSGRVVHHVNSFGDSEESFKEEKLEISSLKKQKKKKRRRRTKRKRIKKIRNKR
ncbi:hypothetical protein K2173_022447 [Erythroxylum novogranatense]|uniref:Uncharacterized protein n=1 Tax=Erythroxylum novogranatense TaxID=1862640 RepID=A0AAV8TJI3_9ROSI|nr:hypothetical protein K2173_022447 [Erythroxylum novogranatense]